MKNLWCLIAAALLLGMLFPTGAGASAQSLSTGTVSIRQTDGMSGATTNYFIDLDTGESVSVDDPRRIEEIRKLNGTRVEVARDDAGTYAIGSLLDPQSNDIVPASTTTRWLTLVCNFIDEQVHQPLSFYDAILGSGINSWPGAGNYVYAKSFGAASLTGNVAGPFQVNTFISQYLTQPKYDLRGLARDCTAVAVASGVNFSGYDRVAFVYLGKNYETASSWSFYLESPTRTGWMNAIWLPDWGTDNQAVIVHEALHSLGLDHALGPDGVNVYGDPFTVISDSWKWCERNTHPLYGCLAQGITSYEMTVLNWGGVLNITPGSAYEPFILPFVGLQRGMNGIVLPVSSSMRYYVEARNDVRFGTPTVVVHEVVDDRSVKERLYTLSGTAASAYGAEARYIPSGVFAVSGVKVCVLGMTDMGFVIRVGNGVAFECNPTVPDVTLSTGGTTVDSAGHTATVRMRVRNLGSAASEVAVKAVIPARTAYMNKSATASKGTVTTAAGTITYTIGPMAFGETVDLAYTVSIDTAIRTSTILQGSAVVSWTGGQKTYPVTIIAYPKMTYLPAVGK